MRHSCVQALATMQRNAHTGASDPLVQRAAVPQQVGQPAAGGGVQRRRHVVPPPAPQQQLPLPLRVCLCAQGVYHLQGQQMGIVRIRIIYINTNCN